MQKCIQCQTPFKWSTVYKSLWFAYSPIHCNNCGTKHTITFTSRIIATIMLVVLPLLWMNYSFNEMAFDATISFSVLVLLILVSLFSPFLVHYNSKT
ncbi:TIGR04104 family putative zinc finger protein [Peribacillus sp. FSL H8-0477]|uniref:TIGR04104 family putative zinc finger protein n=1 Tax=Peribacillus sp. FSL H8-0477 TaxID=2921388 RepID=UPI0030FC15D4